MEGLREGKGTDKETGDGEALCAQRRKGIAVTALLVLALALLTAAIYVPMTKYVTKPEELRAYVEERGLPVILAFLLLIALQVFTSVLPAGPFEFAAGVVFGIPRGILVCDLAMAAGSSLAFLLSRRYGMRFAGLFFPPERLAKWELLKTGRKRKLLYFFCMLVPGLPKDMMTYIVGMTDMPYSFFLCTVLIARLPSIALTALLGSAAVYGRKGQLLGSIAGGALFLAAGLALAAVWRKRQPDSE